MDDQQELHRRISSDLDGISPRRQGFDRWFQKWASGFVGGVLRHWLLAANLVNGLLLAGAVAVPLMRSTGWNWLADPLFEAYHWICEQRPERSYFLGGYQMAMDQRMTAIYGSSLLAGLAYIPLRGRIRPLTWRAFFLLSLPIAVDGFTQLFEWRYSTWELRTITGTLFGGGTVWLAYPYFDAVLHPKSKSPDRGNERQAEAPDLERPAAAISSSP